LNSPPYATKPHVSIQLASKNETIKSMKLMRYLVEKAGADILLRNSDGQNALDIASMNAQRETDDFIHYLCCVFVIRRDLSTFKFLHESILDAAQCNYFSLETNYFSREKVKHATQTKSSSLFGSPISTCDLDETLFGPRQNSDDKEPIINTDLLKNLFQPPERSTQRTKENGNKLRANALFGKKSKQNSRKYRWNTKKKKNKPQKLKPLLKDSPGNQKMNIDVESSSFRFGFGAGDENKMSPMFKGIVETNPTNPSEIHNISSLASPFSDFGNFQPKPENHRDSEIVKKPKPESMDISTETDDVQQLVTMLGAEADVPQPMFGAQEVQQDEHVSLYYLMCMILSVYKYDDVYLF